MKLRLLLVISLFLFISCSDDIIKENAEKSSSAIPKNIESAPPIHKAPLYWSVYESCYTRDNYIPEAEWKENIDWVADNLRQYGYKMICIDGWGDVDYNEYGYRTRHSYEWKNNYAWWSKYLQAKGMELGMYDNPLWVNRGAADAGIKIKGTNIPLSTIINIKENAKYFTWVQVDKPGAEQYVKGCIEHYANMGVKYLRVDFLAWYEVGIDKGGRVGITNRPKAHYETALRWMREECDKYGMFLSLVMPNLTNDGELEAKYGDMIRINEDCGKGQWYRFSDMDRGRKYSGWSVYHNPMDGFAYFSKISGRDKVILDGDFIRLNTYKNDEEKKSVISMHLVAGGAVSIADRKTTIGNNLWFYQNKEMLALNEDGFVGKPLSNDPKSENSQIWTGQMRNGDWIIAFFNRETRTKTRSIDFSSLGIKGYAKVRDLWAHADLGEMDSYSLSLAPHACTVLKVVPTNEPAYILPEPWKKQDIGNVLTKGITKYIDNSFLLEASGLDIAGTKDEFNFTWQLVQGDIEFVAKVKNMDNTDDWSKAGLMIRSGLANNAANAMIAITPAQGVVLQSRLKYGYTTKTNALNNQNTDIWLKITRQGKSIKAYYSKDNITWTQLGAELAITFPDQIYVGMATTAHNANKRTKALFSNVKLKTMLPSPWLRQDIGSVRYAGTAIYDEQTNEYRMQASGADIEGTRDEFCFVYREITGDVTLTAQVASLEFINDWSKAGLMIRSGLTNTASNAMIALTPSYGVAFQNRLTNAKGTTTHLQGGVSASVWLQIRRQGNQFTAYYSKDKNTWTQLGTMQTIAMPNTVYVGLALTSHNTTKLVNARFRNVSVN